MGTGAEPARICLLGSANVDLVVSVDRAPGRGETVTGRRFVTVPGGKGANQAIAAARAGATVAMAGAVGRDGYGDQVLAALRGAGVDVAAVARVDGVATGTAHIVVDATGENSIVVVPGANGSLLAPSPDQLAALAGADFLLLQLELPMPAVVAGARAARERGVRVILTPAPATMLPPELLDAVDLLIPNEHEACRLAGTDDPGRAGVALADRVGEVIVTLGAAGSAWFRRDREPVTVPSYDVPVRDTTAAGDTFAGAIAVALAEGRAMEPAMAWASAAAACAVQREGASPSMPSRAEIDAVYAGRQDGGSCPSP